VMKIGCKIRVSRFKPLEQGIYLTWRHKQNSFSFFPGKNVRPIPVAGKTPIRSDNMPSAYTRHVQPVLYGTGKLNTRKWAITFRTFRLLTARTSHGEDKGFHSSTYIYHRTFCNGY
jgi:hypothetical protein